MSNDSAGARLAHSAGWERHASLEEAGFSRRGMEAFEHELLKLPTTSALVVSGGKIAYTYGDIAQVSYLASARKSVLSILYGNYVASGLIRLDKSVAELGIDEDGGLLPVERTATVRDLLTSSSGVYYPAASRGSAPNLQARGSQVPGRHFAYNNWDFNVLGAILASATGRSVFDLLERDLARPLAFEDFDPQRQRMLRLRDAKSRYAAYHMFLSARDMARLGMAMIRRGRWRGRQVVPEAWVKERTAVHVPAADVGAGSPVGYESPVGYGYLWWIPSEGRRTPAWKRSFLAVGNYGQFILGLPAIDTVIVHRRAVTDEFAIARNLGETNFEPAGVSAETFLRLSDLVVAAQKV